MKNIEKDLNGKGLRIGIVMSRFNMEISEGLLAACKAALRDHDIGEDDITLVSVPGALEIPLALQRMASSGKFDALIALGAVVRGETYHFEIVANQSAEGVTSVQLDAGIPVANGILTTNNEKEAQARVREKGADAAQVAIEMANLMRRLDEE